MRSVTTQDARDSISGPDLQTMRSSNVPAPAKDHEQRQLIRRLKRLGNFR